MRPFWLGFEKHGTENMRFKRHVIVLYWDESNREVKNIVNRVRLRHPTVMLKTVDAAKELSRAKVHGVSKFPTILLLKNGREVERLSGEQTIRSQTLLENLFRKAAT